MKIIRELTGKYDDRSEVILSFDGIDLCLRIEDQDRHGKYIDITFKKVFHFFYESPESIAFSVKKYYEKIVELPSDEYVIERKNRLNNFFTENTRCYAVYLNEFGFLKVYSDNITIVFENDSSGQV